MMYPNNILPPQQILQANGKQSIDALRMSPNSSVLIADNTAPIVWKCVSDGLGNVTSEPFDIIPHKTEEQKERDSMLALLGNIDNRLKKLEADYEQSITQRNQSEYVTDKAGVGNVEKRKQSSETFRTNDAEQSSVQAGNGLYAEMRE